MFHLLATAVVVLVASGTVVVASLLMGALVVGRIAGVFGEPGAPESRTRRVRRAAGKSSGPQSSPVSARF
jgi:hypothetical protein